jgi:hypothetical protein
VCVCVCVCVCARAVCERAACVCMRGARARVCARVCAHVRAAAASLLCEAELRARSLREQLGSKSGTRSTTCRLICVSPSHGQARARRRRDCP